MAPTPPESATGMGRTERMVLAAVAALLALLLVWLRGGLHPEAPLERLARQSLDLPVALADGRPTLVEFYADWCEACRAMAPAMDALEQQHRGALDVVLLNVDNPRWQADLERYEVNGIPQLELFAADGRPVGRAIGARRPAELQALVEALIEAEPLPALAGVGATSALTASATATLATTATAPSTTGSEETGTAKAGLSGIPRPATATMSGPRSHG